MVASHHGLFLYFYIQPLTWSTTLVQSCVSCHGSDLSQVEDVTTTKTMVWPAPQRVAKTITITIIIKVVR